MFVWSGVLFVCLFVCFQVVEQLLDEYKAAESASYITYGARGAAAAPVAVPGHAGSAAAAEGAAADDRFASRSVPSYSD
jgi:hypothetical protein